MGIEIQRIAPEASTPMALARELLPASLQIRAANSPTSPMPTTFRRIGSISSSRPDNGHELEFPRGCSEPSSSPEENAKRELQEEMGSTIVSLETLGTMIADTAWGTGDVYLFFAEIDAIKKLQKEENIESYILVSPAEFLNLVANNTIQDGFTLATFTKALAKGLV